MYLQHSLTGKYSETLALQNKNKHKILFNCFMTSHAFQKVTLQNADNSELNFLGWKKWRLLNPVTAGFSGSTCKCHCHENARLQPPPLNRSSHRGEGFPAGGLRLPHFWHSWWGEGRGEIGSLSGFFLGRLHRLPNLPGSWTAKDMQRLYTTNLRCWETAGKRQVESKTNESPQIWLKMQYLFF